MLVETVLLTVRIDPVFVTPVLLTDVRYPMLVETVLLTVKTAPLLGILVKAEASP